jgi:hypothetical protein
MTMDGPTNPPLKVAHLQRIGGYATVAFVALLVGFLPTWITARTRASERDAAQHALGLARTENTLASAAIHARRGDYEVARAAASAFYTDLRVEVDRPQPTFTASQLAMLRPLLAERDQMITLLARADPAAAERLTDAYLAYRRATGALPSDDPVQ